MFRKLWHLPKVCLMMRLTEGGWVAGTPKDPFEVESPWEFIAKLARPAMYFVALILVADIFSKGVQRICHDGSHVYYSVLVHCPADEILAVLHSLEAGPEVAKRRIAEFEAEISDTESDGSSDSGRDRRRRSRAAQNAQAELAIAQVVNARVPWWETEWKRTVVTVDGQSARVYFDICCASSGKRRAWCDCTLHGCGCIRYVKENRNCFAVSLLLWMVHGATDPNMTRATHLKFWPTDAAVLRAALPTAAFADF